MNDIEETKDFITWQADRQALIEANLAFLKACEECSISNWLLAKAIYKDAKLKVTMTRVITYQHAYTGGTSVLCDECSEKPDALAHFPSLGPVAYGQHDGFCDWCGGAS